MPAIRPQPLLAVRDVPASARFYAILLAAERTSEQMASDHDHLYDRLLVDDTLVLQLHAWNAEDHPHLTRISDDGPVGLGVLLWFELDDFDAAVERARLLEVEVVEEVHHNPAPDHRELWLRDPDGYVVVLCSPDGSGDGTRIADVDGAIVALRSRDPAAEDDDFLIIEQVAEFVALFDGVPDIASFEGLDHELQRQANVGCREARGLIRDLITGWRARALEGRRPRGWRSWPAVLQPLAFGRLERVADVLAVAEQLQQDGSAEEVERLVAHLSAISLGKSKSLDRLVDVVAALPHPDAAATAEGLRRRVAYRGVRRADLDLPIFERVEEWAFAVEESFGDVTDIVGRRVGLFTKMAGDLCDLHSAEDWREAAEGLTAANFHDLAALCEAKADRLDAP